MVEYTAKRHGRVNAFLVQATRLVAGEQGRPSERLSGWFYWLVGLVAGSVVTTT